MNKVLIGDVIEKLKEIPDGSVQCVVTSPPYFGLRDYGVEGQMGLEKDPEEYVAKIVEVFREVKRVLKNDGTLWLNLGDSYAGSGKGRNADGTHQEGGKQGTNRGTVEGFLTKTTSGSLKQKDLIGIPWRVALALQQPYYAGRIRDEKDRVWLAAIIDGEGCFFIHKRKAGSDSCSKFTRKDGSEVSYSRTTDTYGVGLEICNTNKAIIDRIVSIVGGGTMTTQTPEQNERRKQTIYRWRIAPNEAKRIAQEVYSHLVGKKHQARLLYNCPSSGIAGAEAHQAMMDLHNGVETKVDYPEPPSLFEPGFYLRQDIIWAKTNCMPESVTDRCTKSHEYIFLLTKSPKYYFDAEAIKEPAVGERWGGTHAKSTKGWKGGTSVAEREGRQMLYETRNRRSVWTIATRPYKGAHFAVFPEALVEPCVKAGSKPGDLILDSFAGSGTTLAVAKRLGRNYLGIELNEKYLPLIEERLSKVIPLSERVRK